MTLLDSVFWWVGAIVCGMIVFIAISFVIAFCIVMKKGKGTVL